ncbi:MAG: hypothetical protein ACLTE4_10265, partial [Christensenellaceae bacterium]
MEVTINDFVRYRKLKQECARLGRQITKLEESNGKQVADKATGSSPYFPYTERHIPIVGLLHNTARINAKKDQLAEMEAEALELLERFRVFLPTVEDIEARETMELYYIDGLKYSEIAAHMGLEGDGSWLMRKVRTYMRSRVKLDVKDENRNDI